MAENISSFHNLDSYYVCIYVGKYCQTTEKKNPSNPSFVHGLCAVMNTLYKRHPLVTGTLNKLHAWAVTYGVSLRAKGKQPVTTDQLMNAVTHRDSRFDLPDCEHTTSSKLHHACMHACMTWKYVLKFIGVQQKDFINGASNNRR